MAAPRIFEDHALSLAERSKRWRLRRKGLLPPDPPRPPRRRTWADEFEAIAGGRLLTAADLVAALAPAPLDRERS